MFCPDCGTWNRGGAPKCLRCNAALPEIASLQNERLDEDLKRVRHITGMRYRVVRRLGSGGMADVFLAEQRDLKRPVVIKVLHPHLAKDEEVAERFRREAEAAGQLFHPHICPIVDAGSGDGMFYIVMPYLPGGSLSDRIARDRALEPKVASAVAVQVATALDYAHRSGVVHRDVKPDNILFDEDGNALLTDFGIATARYHGRLTVSGRAMGTPHYMSPEQAMGKLLDGRSDLYALGIVLYESLTGSPPFDGADAFSVSYKQVHEVPVPIVQVDSRIPATLSTIVMKCLSKAPAERYHHCNDVADALIEFLHEGGTAPAELRVARAARAPIASPS